MGVGGRSRAAEDVKQVVHRFVRSRVRLGLSLLVEKLVCGLTLRLIPGRGCAVELLEFKLLRPAGNFGLCAWLAADGAEIALADEVHQVKAAYLLDFLVREEILVLVLDADILVQLVQNLAVEIVLLFPIVVLLIVLSVELIAVHASSELLAHLRHA